MTKQIIMPEFYKTRWTDNYKILFEKCRQELGFDVHYTDEPDLEDAEVAIIFATPHHGRPNLYVDYLEALPSRVKLIGLLKDLQCYNNPECEQNMHRMFKRYDLILSPYKEMFLKWYPEYSGKFVHFVDWIPYQRYASLPFNNEPFMTCLMSGAVYSNTVIYHDRIRMLEDCTRAKVPLVYIPPPYKVKQHHMHDFVGDKYARLLWGFFCNLTGVGIYKCVLGKYFEIPASSSLMIATSCKDVYDVGLEPGKHYVEIQMEEAPEVVTRVLKYPKDYEAIRHEGRKYVLEKHTELNRFEELKGLLNQL